MTKVAVLVSGGVDSSVALALLKRQGYDVTAFYLKIWLEDELSFLGNCPWEEDLSYVRVVCLKLDVSLEVVNLQKEYFSQVINLALTQIKSGLTPNPDIFCNSLIKFGVFFQLLSEEFDFIATGHYARVVHDKNYSTLELSNDPVKDQSYFLARLSQGQLKKALFPIGSLDKKEVRRLAQEIDLPTYNRKDSQGLCFLGKIKFSDFIKENIGERTGDIVEIETGRVLGKHQGFWFFTIGQRKGLKLGGGPFYVVKKDVSKNIVFVSNCYFEPDKKRDQFLVSDLHWISGVIFNADNAGERLHVKLRHGPTVYDCLFTQQGDMAKVQLIGVRDQGISPGQFVVFYKNNICLGSGMIIVDLDNPSQLAQPG